ncbi:MAG: sensor histidine kinase [Acidimicrobiales bacterium]
MPVSIRLRLALSVAIITAVLTAIGGIAFDLSLAAGMRATLRDSLRRNATRVQAELLAGQLPLATAGHSPSPGMDQTVIQVLRSSGALVFTTAAAGSRSLLDTGELGSAVRNPLLLEESLSGGQDPQLLLAEPVRRVHGLVLLVGASLDEIDGSLARVDDVLYVGGPFVVVLAAAGGLLLAGCALRPVERLRAEAAQISTASPERRLAVPDTSDEIARLAGTLNGLLDRLQGALTYQREFVAAASHELRTPLAVLQAELEAAGKPGRSEAELEASLAVIRARVGRLARLAADLLLLARGDEGPLAVQLVPQRLEPIVVDSLQALRHWADERRVALVLDSDSDVQGLVDSGRFQQIIENLVKNAIDHGRGGEVIEISLRRAGAEAVLEIRDHGPGFPEDFIPAAFERFTRADVARAKGGGGAGLGLPIVRMLVEAHGGSVTVRNHAQGGASVIVVVPAPVGEAP